MSAIIPTLSQMHGANQFIAVAGMPTNLGGSTGTLYLVLSVVGQSSESRTRIPSA